VRIAVTGLLVIATAGALASMRGAGRVDAPPPRDRAAWERACAWKVLAPRGRGASPMPLIAFATPGWLGPVEVTVETRSGRTVSVTTSRAFPWPESLGSLRVGDWCSVTVAGPAGRRAAAAYLRLAAATESAPSATMSRARGW
jgi:hypothetical protein